MKHTEFISLQSLFNVGVKQGSHSELIPAVETAPSSELGYRPNPDDRMKYLYRLMWVDPQFRQSVIDIRTMDKADSRVKRVHKKTASTLTKSGLCLSMPQENTRLRKIWDALVKRLDLKKRQKLISDASGYLKEGNLMMQWVLGPDNKIWQGIRMPSETMIADVNPNGIYKDVQKAFKQMDFMTGGVIDSFALWQITHGRLDPDNYDDKGSMGRPLMDASRTIWKKLTMTEEDLVIRRRDRAPLQKVHVLDGATGTELEEYENKINERRRTAPVDLDYFLNKKGGVTSLQGDENLDHIKDISLLIDSFFAGAPAPKGLFGYADGLNRDILQDMRRDFFEEVDTMQDEISDVYRAGFELELLLNNIDPNKYNFEIKFNERVTETPNQAADRALKVKAIGGSNQTAWEIAGLDPTTEISRIKTEIESSDPYPSPNEISSQSVNITEGNAPKKESATSVSNK
jgi:hypothetical protein